MNLFGNAVISRIGVGSHASEKIECCESNVIVSVIESVEQFTGDQIGELPRKRREFFRRLKPFEGAGRLQASRDGFQIGRFRLSAAQDIADELRRFGERRLSKQFSDWRCEYRSDCEADEFCFW